MLDRAEGRREYTRQWHAKNKEKVREYQRHYREANKETLAEKNREWREANEQHLKSRKRSWYETNKDKVRESGRNARLKRVYGLTSEDWDALFESQDARCANPRCRSEDAGSSKGWHVDHCHTTGKVRGILCNHCNLLLGYAKDDEDVLQGAIEYLKGARA